MFAIGDIQQSMSLEKTVAVMKKRLLMITLTMD
jgi:hypothetical protein